MLAVSVRRSKEGTIMLQSKIIKNEIVLTGKYENTLHVQGIQSFNCALLLEWLKKYRIFFVDFRDWIYVPAA